MAKVLTPDQFKKCPKGTVFGDGEPWHFSTLLILDDIIEADGYWGFWASNPIWVQSNDCGQDADRLREMIETDRSYPSDGSASKFMSYDGEAMEAFFVLERSDWERISGKVQFQS